MNAGRTSTGSFIPDRRHEYYVGSPCSTVYCFNEPAISLLADVRDDQIFGRNLPRPSVRHASITTLTFVEMRKEAGHWLAGWLDKS